MSLEREWIELSRRNPNVLEYIYSCLEDLSAKTCYGKELVTFDDAANILKGSILGYNYLIEMQEHTNRLRDNETGLNQPQ